jgi:hypothetical protein
MVCLIPMVLSSFSTKPQQPREPHGPRLLSASIGDEVLPDLDLDAGDPAPFTVRDD